MYKKALSHFKKIDPVLYAAGLSIEPVVLKVSSDHFSDLCRSIINQQLSVKAGHTILNRFIELYPKRNINPDDLLKINDDRIRSAGISYPKIKYLKDLAQKIINNEIDLIKLKDQDEKTITESLTKVKGIGQWTAEMFMMFSLGRPDIFSGGDLGLRSGIQKIYKLIERPGIKESEKIAQKWSPYRTYASTILWRNNK